MVKEKDILIKAYDLFGSRWARNEPEIKDYACNEYFDLTNDIDIILLFMPRNHPDRKIWETAKKIIKLKGNAIWIGTRDVLTNLAIKTGGVKEYDW